MNAARLFSTILVAVLLTGLVGCSKDKRVENQLKKKDGIWIIDDVQWVYDFQNLITGYTILSEGTTLDAGTFTFHDDGSGSYDYTVSTNLRRTGSFTYSVKDEVVSIVYSYQNVNGPYYQETNTFVGEQGSKKKLHLTGSEAYEDSSEKNLLTGEFNLSRKK